MGRGRAVDKIVKNHMETQSRRLKRDKKYLGETVWKVERSELNKMLLTINKDGFLKSKIFS